MKPVDYRNETFQSLLGRLSGQREAVLAAWSAHGPCTTERLAELSGLSILTLRPRTTELYEMGFVKLVEEEDGGDRPRGRRGGVYRAASMAEAEDAFIARRSVALSGQTELPL